MALHDVRRFLLVFVWTIAADCSVPADEFRRGDVDGDGGWNITDPIRLIYWEFLGGSPLRCLDAADANDDGQLDLSDPVLLLGYLFLGGRAPADPYLDCGSDPTPDLLSCAVFPLCAPPTGVLSGTAATVIADSTEIDVEIARLEGMSIELLSGMSAVASTATGPDGAYSLTGLGQGVYEVRATSLDGKTTVARIDIASGKTTSLNFFHEPRREAGLFASYAGVALNTEAGPNPDLDHDGWIGLADLLDIRAMEPPPPRLLAAAEEFFGRAVLLLPGLDYTVSAADAPSKIRVGSSPDLWKVPESAGTGLWQPVGSDPGLLQRVEIEEGGTGSIPGLGDVRFQANPEVPSTLLIDLKTGRIREGNIAMLLSAAWIPVPLAIQAHIPDGFVAVAPMGFLTMHTVGMTGVLPSELPVFGGMQLALFGICDEGDDFKACKEDIDDKDDFRRWIDATVKDLKRERERLKALEQTEQVRAQEAAIDRAIENLPGCGADSMELEKASNWRTSTSLPSG